MAIVTIETTERIDPHRSEKKWASFNLFMKESEDESKRYYFELEKALGLRYLDNLLDE